MLGSGVLTCTPQTMSSQIFDHGAEECVEIGGAIAGDQLAGVFAIAALAEEENDFSASAGAQLDGGLQSGARIEPCADFAGERRARLESGRMLRRTVASEEFLCDRR